MPFSGGRGTGPKAGPVGGGGLSQCDPDLTLDIDLAMSLASNRRKIGTSRQSNNSGSGSGGSKDNMTDGRQVVRTRGRIIKPHETEPFLSVDTLPDERRQMDPESAVRSVKKKFESKPSSKLGTLSPNDRMSSRFARQSSPSIPSRHTLTRVLSGRQTPCSMSYVVSPQTKLMSANHHVKMPFKHTVEKPDMTSARSSTPARDMKERTALALYHINRMLVQERSQSPPKPRGKLLKAKLKPLYPVKVNGPGITQCRGILGDTHSYTPSPSRTLQRRKQIVNNVNSGEYEHLLERPTTVESVHRTSIASSVDENKDNLSEDLAETQFDPDTLFDGSAGSVSPVDYSGASSRIDFPETEPFEELQVSSSSIEGAAVDFLENPLTDKTQARPLAPSDDCLENASGETTQAKLSAVPEDRSEIHDNANEVSREEVTKDSLARASRELIEVADQLAEKLSLCFEDRNTEVQTKNVSNNCNVSESVEHEVKESRQHKEPATTAEQFFITEDNEDRESVLSEVKDHSETKLHCLRDRPYSATTQIPENSLAAKSVSRPKTTGNMDRRKGNSPTVKSVRFADEPSKLIVSGVWNEYSDSVDSLSQLHNSGEETSTVKKSSLPKKTLKLQSRSSCKPSDVDSGLHKSDDKDDDKENFLPRNLHRESSTPKSLHFSSTKETEASNSKPEGSGSSNQDNINLQDVSLSDTESVRENEKAWDFKEFGKCQNLAEFENLVYSENVEMCGDGLTVNEMENNCVPEDTASISECVFEEYPVCHVTFSSHDSLPLPTAPLHTSSGSPDKNMKTGVSLNRRARQRRYKKKMPVNQQSSLPGKKVQGSSHTSPDHNHQKNRPHSPKLREKRFGSDSQEVYDSTFPSKSNVRSIYKVDRRHDFPCDILERQVGDVIPASGNRIHKKTSNVFNHSRPSSAPSYSHNCSSKDTAAHHQKGKFTELNSVPNLKLEEKDEDDDKGEDDDDVILCDIADDFACTFDDLDQQIRVIQTELRRNIDENSLLLTETESLRRSLQSRESFVKDVAERENDLKMLNSENSGSENSGEEIDALFQAQTSNLGFPSEDFYQSLLMSYRRKCMEVSETCLMISDQITSPRWLTDRESNSHLHHGGKFPVTEEVNETVMNETGQDSLSEMVSDIGHKLGSKLEMVDTNIQGEGHQFRNRNSKQGEETLSDQTSFLEILCDDLSEPRQLENGGSSEKECFEDKGSILEVIATSKTLSKPRQSCDPPRPSAPFPPLCFNVNARPPSGFLYYFSYGPDMNVQRMTTYVRRKVEQRFWGLLFGFNLVFNKKGLDVDAGGFPNIEFNPFCSVEGCVYQLTQSELDLLDKCIGYPEYYEHVVLPVWMSNCYDPDSFGVAQYCVPAVTFIARDKWIEKDTKLCCDYSVSQCLKSSDMLTPAYKEYLMNMTSSQQPTVLAA